MKRTGVRVDDEGSDWVKRKKKNFCGLPQIVLERMRRETRRRLGKKYIF